MSVPLTIQLDEEFLPALDAVASRQKLSREAIVKRAISGLLAAEAVPVKNTLAGGGSSASSDMEAARDEPDPYLVYLDGFLEEWNTPEDGDAFDHL